MYRLIVPVLQYFSRDHNRLQRFHA